MEQLPVQMMGITVVPQVESYDLKAALEKQLRQREYVQGLRAAFPTMQKDGHPAGAVLWTRVKTLQPNSIAAVEQEGFLSSDYRRGPAHDRSTARRRACQHGLQVPVPEPPRRLEIFAVRGHGRDAPERWPMAPPGSAHTNLHAVVGAGGAVPFASREIARDRRILDRQDGRVTHGGLHLQRSVRRMADIASDIGESERNALSG